MAASGNKGGEKKTGKQRERKTWQAAMAFFLALLLCFFPLINCRAEDAFSKHFSYYQEVGALLLALPEEDKIVVSKNADQPMPIASMTKMMTYYVVKKSIKSGAYSEDKQVKISAQAAALNRPGYSSYGLKEGEVLPVKQLLKGLMVVSGNDAARALAELDAGSEAAFIKKMNAEARKLGMKKTTFYNSSGLTEQNGKANLSSAMDMYRLAKVLYQEFPEVGDYGSIMEVKEPERSYVHISTIAQSLHDIPGILFAKTGTTEEAGCCFTGLFDIAAEQGGPNFRLAAVVMGAPTSEARWRTAKEIVDFSAGSLMYRQIIDNSVSVHHYSVPNSKEKSVALYPEESYGTVTFADTVYQVKYDYEEGVQAPTEAEARFGKIHIEKDGKELKTINIISHLPTTEAGFFDRLGYSLSSFFNFVFSLI